MDTAPAIARKPRAKTTTKTPGAKPAGVTKKTAPKKESGVAKKVKTAAKKVEAKVKKATTTVRLSSYVCVYCKRGQKTNQHVLQKKTAAKPKTAAK